MKPKQIIIVAGDRTWLVDSVNTCATWAIATGLREAVARTWSPGGTRLPQREYTEVEGGARMATATFYGSFSVYRA